VVLPSSWSIFNIVIFRKTYTHIHIHTHIQTQTTITFVQRNSDQYQRFLVNDQRDAQILFYVFISIYNSLHVSST